MTSAKPKHMDMGIQQGSVAALINAVAELPMSAAGSRKVGFDEVSIDKVEGLAALTQVYLDGYLGFSPFLKNFVVSQCILVLDKFARRRKGA